MIEAELLAEVRHYTTMEIRSCLNCGNKLGFVLGDGSRWIQFTFTHGQYERMGIKALTHKAVAQWYNFHAIQIPLLEPADPRLYNYVD